MAVGTVCRLLAAISVGISRVAAAVDQLQVLLHLRLQRQVGENGGVAEDAVVQGRLRLDGLLAIRVSSNGRAVVQKEVKQVQGAVLAAQGLQGGAINLWRERLVNGSIHKEQCIQLNLPVASDYAV